jgi:hypothetical protein
MTAGLRCRAMIAAAVACLGVLAPAASHATTPNPLANPVSDTVPSNAFIKACYAMGTSKSANEVCDKAALVGFDKVRAAEGLGPMTLPGDFAQLTVPVQLLTISNIERVDRGLTAIKGLSARLNTYAQAGANTDDDPGFPQPLTGAAGSNWSGLGNSALLDDFFWMYDDGLGSPNGACTATDPSGCWGHRDNIIGSFGAPIFMGAAVAYRTSRGTSMTEEYVGDDTVDTAEVLPFTMSRHRLAVRTHSSTPAHVAVTVTAPSGGRVHARITAGRSVWSLTPAHCTLRTGASCALHLRFAAHVAGRHDGTLTVSGPGGQQRVSLVGVRQSR